MTKSLFMHSLNSNLIKLPTPINISYWWNFGSLLGCLLLIQFISGILLSFHYCPNTNLAFNSIIHINQNTNNGWLIRNIHINGASMFFICIYSHMARNLYFHSFNLKLTWMTGVSTFILSMTTAFLGYVLPWGQMSFWGATVITNLLTAIPYLGNPMVEWLWGGYAINNATLNRFFSFHFLMPFAMILTVFLHLLSLHKSGSKNPLGLNSNLYKIPFHNYFTMKDILGFILLSMLFMILTFQYPLVLSDPDNFINANPLITPPHIQPEWYFLFAYAILRSIPNKLGGVVALIMSILVLYTHGWTKYHYKTNAFYPLNQTFYWIFINTFILLTLMGMQPIEYPFINISMAFSMMYFTYFILNYIIYKIWDYIMDKSMKI